MSNRHSIGPRNDYRPHILYLHSRIFNLNSTDHRQSYHVKISTCTVYVDIWNSSFDDDDLWNLGQIFQLYYIFNRKYESSCTSLPGKKISLYLHFQVDDAVNLSSELLNMTCQCFTCHNWFCVELISILNLLNNVI